MALRQGDRQRALDLLDRCAGWFERSGQRSFGAALRHCQGRVVGGEAGAALIHDASRLLADQGFSNPATAVTTHVPGFPRTLSHSQERP